MSAALPVNPSNWIRKLGIGLLALWVAGYIAGEWGGLDQHKTIVVSALPVVALTVLLVLLVGVIAINGVISAAPAEKEAAVARLRKLSPTRRFLYAVLIVLCCAFTSYYTASLMAEISPGTERTGSGRVARTLVSRSTRYNCAKFVWLEIDSRGEFSACLEARRGGQQAVGPDSLTAGDLVLVRTKQSVWGESLVEISLTH